MSEEIGQPAYGFPHTHSAFRPTDDAIGRFYTPSLIIGQPTITPVAAVKRQTGSAAGAAPSCTTEGRIMKTDMQVQKDVAAELHWDPSIRESEIAVAARDGVVTLAGKVHSYAEKYAEIGRAHV